MLLPAMLVGETVGEIVQATQFAGEIVAAVAPKAKKIALEDPKTPMTQRRNQRPNPEDTGLRVRRKKEKQNMLQAFRSECDSPKLQRARSRINFKVSPPKVREFDKEIIRYLANRVSPRNKSWAKKTIVSKSFVSLSKFTAAKFLQDRVSSYCKQQAASFVSFNTLFTAAEIKQDKVSSYCTTPHKFLIKSQPSASKFQVKIINPPVVSSLSPTRTVNLSTRSPKFSTASKLCRSFSPSRLTNRLVSPVIPMRLSTRRIQGIQVL